MQDQDKTQCQLIDELKEMRRRVSELEAAEVRALGVEKALRESEERFRLLYEDAPLGYQSLDENGNFLAVNQAWLDVLGYCREEVIGKWFADFLAIGYQDHFKINFPRFKAAGELHDLEFEMVRKDGAIIPVAFDGKIGRDQGGSFKHIHCILRDITERKRSEEAATREIGERYRQLVENASDIIFQTDVGGSFTFVNPVVLRLTGYTEKEILGKHFTELIRPDHREEVMRFYGRQFVKRLPVTYYEFPMVTKQGMTLWIGQSTQTIMDGETFVGFQSIARDINERKQVEEQLRRANQEQERLLSTAATAIFTLDSAGIVAGVNEEFSLITGFEKNDIIGKSSSVLQEQQSEEPYSLFQLGAKDRLVRHQCSIRTKDGRVLTVLKNASLEKDDEGKIIGGIESFIDVTELIEARKLAEQASVAKSEFLANMSHEIRTPINGIIGMTGLALNTPLTNEQRDYLQSVMISADSLLGLINDILDFSKIEAGKLELSTIQFSLRDCVANTLTTLAIGADNKGLELVYRIPMTIPDAVVGDPGRLRQVLVNLVGNAIKFTAKGEVAINAELELETDKEVSVHFSVTDTGIGIPFEQQARIFNAFEQADGSTTREYGGTGLGLTVCARLVEMMKGRIWVESEVDRGSVFHFTVYFSLATEPAPRSIHLETSIIKGLSALVVDDNSTNRRILEEILKSWGMKPTSVTDGKTALEVMKQAQNLGSAFPIALIDYMMPGMDGFELVERIKDDPDLVKPIMLILTSAGQRGHAARCVELGVSAYLLKPIHQQQLLETICASLQKNAVVQTRPSLLTRHSIRESSRRINILLAEDNLINQKLAVSLLQKMGHNVTVAQDGKQAVAMSEIEQFDLVLMDVQMPEMDGLEATAAIRSREESQGRPRVPILAMTAYAMTGDSDRCIEAGMDGYISKPINTQELFEAIENMELHSS